MFKSIVVKAPAKVNISLEIRGFVESYHDLQSLMAKVDLYDVITITERPDKLVNVVYSTGESYPCDNALNAAVKIIEKFNLNGVDITIEKGVPEGVGLGGSAVDAAGIARGLKELYDISYQGDFLITLGGDVPFLASDYDSALVRGKGEQLTPVPLKQSRGILVYGKERVSTKAVFDKYDELCAKRCIKEAEKSGLVAYNALESAAIDVNPLIKQYRDALIDSGFSTVVMTGGGSGFIAIDLGEECYDDKVNQVIALCDAMGFSYKKITWGTN